MSFDLQSWFANPKLPTQPEQAVQPRPKKNEPAAPPPPQEWDYRNAAVGPNGEALPRGAQGWTPFGKPYFGAGLQGTLKKYAWMMFGSPTEGQQLNTYNQFQQGQQDVTQAVQATNPYSPEARAALAEQSQNAMAGIFGTNISKPTAQDEEAVQKAKDRIQEIREQYMTAPGQFKPDAPEEIKQEFQELSKQQASQSATNLYGKTAFEKDGKNVSLLTPVLRGTQVGLAALFDVLGEAAIKFEQTQSSVQAMSEYADKAGSPLPNLRADIDRVSEEKSERWQSVFNLASRVLMPALAAYDTTRFIFAPGTVQEKKDAMQTGWDAGKMFYSQIWKPSLLDEYKRRAAAGDDPQLLAMELQNPWAEAVGQIILDPLNVVGLLSKGAKAAALLDDAQDAVKGGTLGDEVGEVLADITSPIGDTRAAGKLDELDAAVMKNVKRVDEVRLTPDYNSLTAYSPTGARVREYKTVSAATQITTGAIMRNGGSADDVVDFLHTLSKVTDSNQATRMEALDDLLTMSSRYGMGRFAFSDDMLETGILLKNLADDGEDLLKTLKGKGNFDEVIELLDKKMQAAVEKQFVSVSDLKKAKKGTPEAAVYESLKPAAKALWSVQEGAIGGAKNWVNSSLAKFYFASPGFIARNSMNNMFTMLVDSGLSGTAKSFYRDGKYWSLSAIDEDIARYFGGQIPPSMKGMTLTQSEKASSIFTKANDYAEAGFAKRIYWSRFRDQMDMFLTPGVALPTRNEFKALGMTDSGIDQLVSIIRRETGGNIEQGLIKYAERFGDDGLMDAWRQWDGFVSPEDMRGLREMGLTEEIDELAAAKDMTPQQIREKIAKLKQEQLNRAASAADNPVGVNRERKGFEFVEKLSESSKYGTGGEDSVKRLNILIEKSEQTSDQLAKAIGQARDTVTDPAMRGQFGIMEDVFSAERRVDVRQTAQQLTDTAWEYTKRAKKGTVLDLERMWNQSILAKTAPAPKGLTQQEFLDSLWNATRTEISTTWENYFSEGFDQLAPLIENLSQTFPQMTSLFRNAQKASAELNLYRTATYRGGKIFTQVPPKNIFELAQRYGIPSATEAGAPNNKQLLNTINKYSDVKYKTLEEVPLQDAERALQARKTGEVTEGAQVVVKATDDVGSAPTPNPETELAAPYVDGSPIQPGEMWKQTSDGVIAALTRIERGMLDNFGMKAVDKLDNQVLKKLKTALLSARDAKGLTAADKVTEGIAAADKIGKHWRDFALLPYGETKNFDLALSYIYPYQFWYSRSYANWMKRIASDPQVLAHYAKIKQAMSKENSDMPEWWRYNVEIPSHFLGLPNEHPMSFNLEASIFPLYGLTGTDFNDPEKRTNWLTSTIDDAGKFGPSLWAPIQHAIGLYYRAKGENEVAASWANRLIPQTATIKAASSLWFGKPIELDPAVQIFSGEGLMDFSAMDKWERRRVGLALGQMVKDGILTEEQAVEVANSQQGEYWDMAVQNATKKRAPGQLLSYILGVGFKPRTPMDREVDQFYAEYNKLSNLREAGLVSPQQYQQAFDAMREKYDFMDVVLLSRKSGPDRERAYLFNVFGRIPPGQASEIYKAVGLDPRLAQEFYDNGGDMTGWSKAKKDAFMASGLNLGAMLALPDYAVKQEWNEARNQYKNVTGVLTQMYGEDINEKIDFYYGMDDKAQAKLFLDMHPEVQQAMDFQKRTITENPLLYEYYGGIETLEQVYRGQMYDQLDKAFPNIQKTLDEYYGIYDTKAKNKFKKAHPELTAYWNEKERIEEENLKKIVDFANLLPEAEKPEWTGQTPETPAQQDLLEYMQERKPTFEEWSSVMGPQLTAIVSLAWQSGQDMPRAAVSELDYLSEQYGYESGDEMLRDILISMGQPVP